MLLLVLMMLMAPGGRARCNVVFDAVVGVEDGYADGVGVVGDNDGGGGGDDGEWRNT